MQDRLVSLLDGQRFPEKLRRAHVNRLERAGGNVTGVEDERVRQAQRIDDLVENAASRDGICRQLRGRRRTSHVSRLTANSRCLRS